VKLLPSGHWLGKGSLLLEGRSLGDAIECDLEVEADDGGTSLRAALRVGDRREALVIRVAGNDVGTYVVSVRSESADTLMGSAKLDSEPNLGLLWNEAGTLYATFALFSHGGGIGCRGYLREGDATYTWELSVARRQDVVKGDNVVSLRPRRR
jgi:hypothetical protein